MAEVEGALAELERACKRTRRPLDKATRMARRIAEGDMSMREAFALVTRLVEGEDGIERRRLVSEADQTVAKAVKELESKGNQIDAALARLHEEISGLKNERNSIDRAIKALTKTTRPKTPAGPKQIPDTDGLFRCRYEGCDDERPTAQGRTMHERRAHGANWGRAA